MPLLSRDFPALATPEILASDVADYLIHEGASFERLALVGIEYAPHLEIRAGDLKYLGESARFELR